MRNNLAFGAIFALLIFLIPLLALWGEPEAMQLSRSDDANTASSTQGKAADTAPAPAPEEKAEEKAEGAAAEAANGAETAAAEAARGTAEGAQDNYRLRDSSTGKVLTVSAQDFVRGALAAEMPPTFHPEALKAQAVAAHTYALYVKQTAEEDANEDLIVDTKNWKSFVTEKLFRERYGALADSYWQTICAAADEVCGYLIIYEGEPIVAAYHSMSGGETEDAGNVWTGGKPYLVPAESRGDTLAPDFATTQTFTTEEVAAAVRGIIPGVKLDMAAPGGWIQITERSESGYATELLVGNETIRGVELRSALELRSAHFEVAYSGGAFEFAVKGYGHGVGLSQYGADYMARQGATFDEILLHYYSGATLTA